MSAAKRTGYSEVMLDHFQNPRNSGDLNDADGEATVTNPVCGDVTRLQLKVTNDTVAVAKWKTQGCSTSIAASSILTEIIRGMCVADAALLKPSVVTKALGGLPQTKTHSSVLAVDALKSALADYISRRSQAA